MDEFESEAWALTDPVTGRLNPALGVELRNGMIGAVTRRVLGENVLYPWVGHIPSGRIEWNYRGMFNGWYEHSLDIVKILNLDAEIAG